MCTLSSLRAQLSDFYDDREAQAIVFTVLEEGFNLSRADVYSGALEKMDGVQRQKLGDIMSRLSKGEPVQYVLGTASFCDRTFIVRPGVLIPRPETQWLCSGEATETINAGTRILDIGTGSGCIAITMALNSLKAYVEAWDISDEAIKVAQENNSKLGANVTIRKRDILKTDETNEKWDIIVSNPPYIAMKEKASMHTNVVDYEPHEALFVSDDDPLLFYKAIARYAAKTLDENGRLLLEINPLFVNEMTEMLQREGFDRNEIHEDIFGKQRFIICRK